MPMSQDFSKTQTGAPRSAIEVETLEPSAIISPDTRRDDRIPPNQRRTMKWPVLHYSHVPTISTETWTLEVMGLVNHRLHFSWEQFQTLPRVKVYSDFHCVTRWSRLDNIWEGVSVHELLRQSGIQEEAKFAIIHGYDNGWTTNMPLADFLGEDVLVADLHDGEPLSADHGGPARLVVPRLYAWKSAKWIKAIELTANNQPGLWERGGYHDQGNPWTESRFRDGWFNY